MQTFITHHNFWMSARNLDDKRLGKQRVEVKQILDTCFKIKKSLTPSLDNDARNLRDPKPRIDLKSHLKIGWRHHTAVKMWYGYEECLGLYYNECVEEWIKRGFVHNMIISDIMPGNMTVSAKNRASLTDWAIERIESMPRVITRDSLSKGCWPEKSKGRSARIAEPKLGDNLLIAKPVEFANNHSFIRYPWWWDIGRGEDSHLYKIINSHRFALLNKEIDYYEDLWSVHSYMPPLGDPPKKYHWPESRVPMQYTF